MKRAISWNTLLRKRKNFIGGQIHSIEDTHEYIGRIGKISFDKKTKLVSIHCSWVAGRPKYTINPWTMAWTPRGGHMRGNAMSAGFNGKFETNIEYATPARNDYGKIEFSVMYCGERILTPRGTKNLLKHPGGLDENKKFKKAP